LTLDNASIDDSATFTINAKNESGEASASFNLKSNLEFKSNEPCILETICTGIPTPNILWLDFLFLK